MSDIPPKVVRSQVRSVRRRAPGSPARTGGLPVLHAFQTFIDTERRRAQRRLLGLAFVFLALLICVAGAGVLAGRHFLNQANDKYLDLEEAKEVARAWLFDNANQFFRLGL